MSVVVAHPGKQHVYQTVLAAQEAGCLQAFATSVYLNPSSRFARGTSVFAARFGARGVVRSALGRSHPEIDARKVVTFPWWATAARLTWALPFGSIVEAYAARRTDVSIARWLSGLDPKPQLVHGFEGGARSTFATARRRGIMTVLDVANAQRAPKRWARAAVLRALYARSVGLYIGSRRGRRTRYVDSCATHGYTLKTLLLHPVPRFVWPDKPRQADDLLNVALHPHYVEGRAGPAYSVLGGLYFDLGLVGVFIGMTIVGVGWRLLWRVFSANRSSLEMQLLYAAALPFTVVLSRGTFLDSFSRALFVVAPLVVIPYASRLFSLARA